MVVLDFKKSLEVQKKYWGCRKKIPNYCIKKNLVNNQIQFHIKRKKAGSFPLLVL